MEPGGAVMQAHLWGVSGLAQAPTSARTTQALALNAVQASGPVGQDVSLYPTHHSHGTLLPHQPSPPPPASLPGAHLEPKTLIGFSLNSKC